MMANDFIIHVNESDFEYEVIAFSNNTPVVVDFWAEWCKPCQPLTALLERLVKESQGGIRLALVNSDLNPNLAIRFGVRSLPTVKVFSGGEVTAEFVGAQPEGRVREFLAQIQPPSPAALLIEKGYSLISIEAWANAEGVFREALDLHPDHPGGLLGLAKSLLAQGKSHEGLALLTSFPTSRQYAQAQTLLPLAEDIDRLRNIDPAADLGERHAAYWNALRLVSRGKITPALDGLLDLLRSDKQDQTTRKVVLSLFELLGDDNPVTREYRKEFAAILF
ncbi:MAG: tetratricopeptide repeat protein [Bellilinea sp.]